MESKGKSSETSNTELKAPFNPSDEKLLYYLQRKVLGKPVPVDLIHEDDNVYRVDSSELPYLSSTVAAYYCFCSKQGRDLITPTVGSTAVRIKKRINSPKGHLLGWRKTLEFYRGPRPKTDQSDWVMHEYTLDGSLVADHKDVDPTSFVLCKIFKNPDDEVPIIKVDDVPKLSATEGSVVTKEACNSYSTLPVKMSDFFLGEDPKSGFGTLVDTELRLMGELSPKATLIHRNNESRPVGFEGASSSNVNNDMIE